MVKKVRAPREKWHQPERLELEKLRLRKIALSRMTRLVSGEPGPLEVYLSLHVHRDCDLRATLEEKALSCNKFSAWTIFVNKRNTLIHVVPRDGDFHIRLPLYVSIGHVSDQMVERLVQSTLNGRAL